MSDMVQLCLTNLGKLDTGKIDIAFKREIERVVLDCRDRPDLKKKRQIALIFNFTPEMDETSRECHLTHVGCDIKTSIPTRKTRVYAMHVQGKEAFFRPDNPVDPTADQLFDKDVLERVNPVTGEITKLAVRVQRNDPVAAEPD